MKIRRVEMKDAESMLEMMLALDNETKYMLLEPGERSKDIHRIQGMIDSSVKGGNLLLGAYENDNIVGFLSAQRGTLNKIKHTAYIVTGIREAYRGKGIGGKLFSELDIWAEENNVSRLELTVMCPNEIAKHLYEKNGFEVEGIKKKSIFMDGHYVDEYYMAKVI